MLIDRRLFLKSLGVISGSTVVSCNGMAPEEKLEAYLSPPKEMIPGTPAYYATVCRACPAGCGIVVKTREGRPIKLEGNPEHPVNKGKLCMRGQAFVDDLYSQNRVKTPVVNGKETSWDASLKQVASHLKKSNSVGFITGLESSTFDRLISDFSARYSSHSHVNLEAISLVSMSEASNRLFGKPEVPRIDLSGVSHLVSLGADILDTWVSPVAFSGQLAAKHAAEAGRTLTMDYIGPARNLTATAADNWYRASARDIGALSLALLHGVYKSVEKQLAPAEATQVNQLIKKLGPRPSHVGISEDALKAVVKALASTPHGLVLFGGSQVISREATAIHDVVLLINYLLGAVGKSLVYGSGYNLSKVHSEKDVAELLSSAAKGTPEVLFIYGANPAYTLPGGLKVKEALEKTKLVVALAHTHDETTAAADVVLPVHHPLESWGDYDVADGISGLMQPVRAPLYNSRHVGDLLIKLSEKSGQKLAHKSYKGYVVQAWSALAATMAASNTGSAQTSVSDGGADNGADAGAPTMQAPPLIDESAWEAMLVQGGRFAEPQSPAAVAIAPNAPLERIGIRNGEQAELANLVVPFSVALHDGRGATNAWLRETPDPLTQTAWDIPVLVSEDLAKKKQIADGDIVELKSTVATVTAKAMVSPDLISETIALSPGGGRLLSRESENTGSAAALLPGLFDSLSGELVWSGPQVSINRVSKNSLVSVMGSDNSEGRLLALSMGLSGFKKKQFPKLTRHGQKLPGEIGYNTAKPLPLPRDEEGGTRPADNMYSLQEHAKHRWGLVVDLDKCTGCSACVVACYAENNIPVVGSKEVAKGRELSWMRIEKHVFLKGSTPRVQFLPVMCQHCDNAPCEPVCPVFAATHTTDGLNAQVYNRCVGTRYCANNCPYKVRRFNYFDYKRDKPANQQLNPDVTVRSRGVMEKCTFCIQRIREAQNRNKLEGKPLQDGDIVPACVQTCPSGALAFGDFKQPKWAMSKLADNPRAYRLLDYMVNTRPGVVYLRKVLTNGETE